MLRSGYSLSGLGSGLCTNDDELQQRVSRALAHSPQVLVEEYLTGWKEIEYEVVRDRFDNCVTVCNMENFDPMGIHTGESIVVAPSQTLSNDEYHQLRSISIKVVRHLGIVGECNIQFALHPSSDDYRVIEVNARLSRSSALASKATGYPLASVAAKLGLGSSLVEMRNSVTASTSACFEPALDYGVVKAPRWDLQKFRLVSKRLGSGMKSVGEVMAIGRSFEEAFQKALRMLDIGVSGLVGNAGKFQFRDLESELRDPSHERVFAIPEAIKHGYPIQRIHELSHIDLWFLQRIEHIVNLEGRIRAASRTGCSSGLMLEAKQSGFADRQIADLQRLDETKIRKQRETLGIFPCVKQIDTLAAEYPAQTNYLYLTYNGHEDDIAPHAEPLKSIVVLGSGPYRIGSSVEFDWCSVNAVKTLRELGYHTVIVNCNPETVSTDYNECDTLYSYVLSGAAMAVASNSRELEQYLHRASGISRKYPVVVSKFFENSKELEIDAVASKGELVASAISEHVENAGVHSGDATLVVPPQRTYLETIRRVRKITQEIARSLRIDGPFNIQLLPKGNEVRVIECNLRASRSFPFVSKILKTNFIAQAIKVIMGHPVPKLNNSSLDLDYVGVKAPHFSFTRLDGADPTLGVEMASTGEVACLGNDFEEAFLKAMLSVGYRLPIRSVLLSTGPIEAKATFLEKSRMLERLGLTL